VSTAATAIIEPPSKVAAATGAPEVVRAAPPNLPGTNPPDWSKVIPNLQMTLIQSIRENHWPIVIHGPTGVGKSYTSACIYQRWATPSGGRKAAFWYRVEEFVRDIQKCRMSRDNLVMHRVNGQIVYRTEAKLWQFAADANSLWCLDDFGTRGLTDSAFDVVFELIDRRVGKPTIVTSNLDLQGITDLYDDRIADRLRAGTVIELTGESRRTGKRYRV
jgi:DNA replication protein DnaC